LEQIISTYCQHMGSMVVRTSWEGQEEGLVVSTKARDSKYLGIL
jgi:hypothetical protein